MKPNKVKTALFSSTSFFLLALAAFCAVAWYIWFCSDAFISADSLDTFLWTKASADAGKLFNPDFHYAAALPFGGNLIMLPGYWLFGFTLAGQKLGMFCFLILFTAALLFFCRSIHFSWKWSFFSLFVVFCTLSCAPKLREIFFDHIIYYSLGNFQFLVGASLILRYWDTRKTQKGLLYFALCLVWTFLCATNGLEGLVLFGIPLLITLLINALSNAKAPSLRGFAYTKWFLLCSLFIAVLLGYAFGTILTRNVFTAYAGAFSGFGSSEFWASSLTGAPFQFILLFCTNLSDAVQFMSKEGLFGLLSICFAIALMVIPVIASFFYKKYKTDSERALILYHWVSTFFVLFPYVFGRLANANWRLTPIILTSLLVSIQFCRYLYQQKTNAKRFGVLLIVCCLLISCVNIYHMLSLHPSENKDTGLRGLASQLEKEDVDYGYATFWNAAPLTIHTNSKVLVTSIDLHDDGTIAPSQYQTFDSHYLGHSNGNIALILDIGELEKLDDSIQNKISRMEEYDSYRICFLTDDIFPS